MDFVAISHDRFHLAARLPTLMRAGFIAECGRGERTKNVRAGECLAVGVGPGEIHIEKLYNGGAVTFGGRLDKFAVGLQSRRLVGCGSSMLAGHRKQEAAKQNSKGEHTNNETPHDSRSSLDFPDSVIPERRTGSAPGPFPCFQMEQSAYSQPKR